ncbi:MAG: 2Fe-2S iron-sulfur cluster-binding protein, partial [Candidatus Omnitrophica bacterium]|nr:2Fe-2S iron-sulfur cluster-binding protein [Candidatus Omnitrophota bacterium]
MDKVKVKFYPDNKSAEAENGSNLLSCAISAGIYINSSCGGDGICGKCRVIVKKGDVQTQATGKISHEERKKGYVLACLSTVHSDAEIEIPAESRLGSEKINVYTKTEHIDSGRALIKDDVFVHSPLATKLYLDLPQPTLSDRLSDLERLQRGINKIKKVPIMQAGLANIRGLGEILRSSDWKVTVTLGNRNSTTEIVLVEP